MNLVTRTYGFNIYDPRFFELAKESGEVYTASLNKFWEIYNNTGEWINSYKLQEIMKDFIQRNNLHSDSYLGALQQVHKNLASWKEAKKVRPELKPPYKSKFLYMIIFKKSQISRKKGDKLSFSLNKNEKFVINWNKSLPTPTYAHISYNKTKGWILSATLELEVEAAKELDCAKHLSIDLGVKRIAALFDGDNVVNLSGKQMRGLVWYRNKLNAKTQSKLSKKIKGSNNYKKIQRAKRKATARLNNIKKDILHKQSRFIVEYAIHNKIGNIDIGDCSGTHINTNLGVNNQQVQQYPERVLAGYIEYKFKAVGGTVTEVPEYYTTKRCPLCGKINYPNNRVYKCKPCNYIYDRDGVGTINIYKKVSSVGNERIRLLTRPFGVKFKNDLSFKKMNQLLSVKKEPCSKERG
jgi:putative transposase